MYWNCKLKDFPVVLTLVCEISCINYRLQVVEKYPFLKEIFPIFEQKNFLLCFKFFVIKAKKNIPNIFVFNSEMHKTKHLCDLTKILLYIAGFREICTLHFENCSVLEENVSIKAKFCVLINCNKLKKIMDLFSFT